MKPNGDRELKSWKEIATYLEVGVRTAQAWETQRGLPVRRLPGPRGQVSVLASDLEEWKRSGLTTPEPASVRRPYWILALLLPLAAGLFFGWSRTRTPVHYRVDRNTLIVMDAQRRELWRRDFPSLDEQAYAARENVWIGDLGNGQTTVLMQVVAARVGEQQGLIAFDRRGHELWRFVPGREVRTGTKTFAPPYQIAQFVVAPFGRDHRLRIAVTSVHHLYYPCQLVLLDSGGRVVREYWHSGQLPLLLAYDLGDGWNSLVAAGINNANKSSTLVVLDPDNFAGANTEGDSAFQLQGFPAPVETVRLLFPRSCINQKLEPFTITTRLWRESDAIGVEVQHRLSPPDASLFYQLNKDLTVRDVSVGSSFTRAHLALHATGVIDHDLQPSEVSQFRNLFYITASSATAPRF